MKHCNTCGQSKPFSEFYTRNKGTYYFSECKECTNKRARDWGKAHKDRRAASLRELRKKWRKEALDILGRFCIRCENTDWRVLEFHHIQGQQGVKKKQVGFTTIRDIRMGRLSDKEIEVLCANCHRLLDYQVK